MVGSVTWVIDASWGWHWDGWMIKLLGYHDAYASGVIHAVAGGAALAVLIKLGPRIGKFGTQRRGARYSAAKSVAGLYRPVSYIYRLLGLFMSLVISQLSAPETSAAGGATFTATNIYLTPTTLSAITFNFLMSLSGGLLAGYMVSRGDAFWTYSGGLAGVITASAGNDLYHPIQAFLIGGAGVFIAYKMHFWVERKFRVG